MNELHANIPTGSSASAIIRSPLGQLWNGSAFENWLDAHYATYLMALSEQGTSGYFAADFPAAILSGGTYTIEYVYRAQGSTPSIAGDSAASSDFLVRGASAPPSGSSASPADMVLILKAFLASNAGVKQVNVDGVLVTLDRAQALEELQYWQRQAAAAAGTRKLFRGFNMTKAF
jgi:hypothetical protein